MVSILRSRAHGVLMRIPRGAIAAACRHALEAPDVLSDPNFVAALLDSTDPSMPEAVQLATSLLDAPDADFALRAATWLVEDATGEPREKGIVALRRLLRHAEWRVRTDALRLLASARVPEAADWIRPLMADESFAVRRNAAISLYEHFPDEPIDPLIELLRDPERDVRAAAAVTLGRLLDRDAFPALIEALRDPDPGVRTAAEAALDAIQGYHDRIDRWKKWLRESEIDADSAAEALLAQAGASNPREVRLAAIRSLGTLAVPETLPILIRMMTESDPDIARAAREAVERINRTKETAEAPAGEPAVGKPEKM
jgi:HEAT repeat protein